YALLGPRRALAPHAVRGEPLRRTNRQHHSRDLRSASRRSPRIPSPRSLRRQIMKPKPRSRKSGEPQGGDAALPCAVETSSAPTAEPTLVSSNELRKEQTAAWILSELQKRGSDPKKFVQAYCALLLLRLGEWLNEEERAIAEFEGRSDIPDWPSRF